MNKLLTEIGFILQFLGAIPPIVPALRSQRQAARSEFETSMHQAEKYGLSPADKWWIFGGFALVALGAAFQFVAVLL